MLAKMPVNTNTLSRPESSMLCESSPAHPLRDCSPTSSLCPEQPALLARRASTHLVYICLDGWRPSGAESIGNANGLFHHPRAHPPRPPAVLPLGPAPGVGPPAQRARPRRVCPRAPRAPGSHSPATPVLSGLALRTCLVLGERLQALRCEPGARGETGAHVMRWILCLEP
jgi:hypothetical protein